MNSLLIDFVSLQSVSFKSYWLEDSLIWRIQNKLEIAEVGKLIPFLKTYPKTPLKNRHFGPQKFERYLNQQFFSDAFVAVSGRVGSKINLRGPWVFLFHAGNEFNKCSYQMMVSLMVIFIPWDRIRLKKTQTKPPLDLRDFRSQPAKIIFFVDGPGRFFSQLRPFKLFCAKQLSSGNKILT